MIEQRLTPERLRPGLPAFIWALGVVTAGKLAAASGSAAALMAWEALFLFVIPMLLPLRYLLATILAVVVFLDASLWFLQGNFPTDTVYESEGALVKPPEILLLALVLRLGLVRNLPDVMPSGMKAAITAWCVVIVIGVFTALMLERPLRDVLIYSEVRSPVVMVLYVLALAPVMKIAPRFFIDMLALMVLAHFPVSLLSWWSGVSLFWPSYAPSYVGSHYAFFGADESVMVYLLANALALGMLVSSPDARFSEFGRKLWAVVFLVTAFAIVASLRRGGVGALVILVLALFLFSGWRSKLRLVAVLAVLSPLFFGASGQLGMLDAFFARLQGDERAQMSNAGHLSDLMQGMAYAAEHFWFGTGAATKVALIRTQAYGVSETLSIHNAVLHIWVRYGVFGALAYAVLFLMPLALALAAITERRSGLSGSARGLVIAMSGLLFALFLWTLATPAVFLNFRQSAVWAFGVAMILALLRVAEDAAAADRQAGSAPRAAVQGNARPGRGRLRNA